VSELVNDKVSRITADLLAKYLYRLGREVTTKTELRPRGGDRLARSFPLK
jgi:hypothetical protein